MSTLTIPRQSFPCPHCYKMYRRKRECELHKVTCGLVSRDEKKAGDIVETAREIENRQDNMDLLTHAQMCDIIKILVRDQEKLKTQVKTLQTALSTIRRKVTVEDYLAGSSVPECDITQFGVKLGEAMTEDDFSDLLEIGLDKTLELIVLRIIQVQSVDAIPMRTFTGHTGTVYCFDGKWRKMTDADWLVLSGVVKRCFMKFLKEWTDRNEHRLTEDAFSLRYNTHVQKIMSYIPRIQNKLMSLICQHVRVSLNGITTFEFVFN